ncbi:hypothetical protein NC653_010306 [Populus alba x Populus x berolinensis]|uniref:Uncharacterized protein n=1 Tax=Populus alba x Populus x berolinensis TaxID=444605 RepID=A0AAD6QZG7_9ROSI|nr:hypothetical protein NC653_010306 [Populus alba x Populus x berolinensis]
MYSTLCTSFNTASVVTLTFSSSQYPTRMTLCKKLRKTEETVEVTYRLTNEETILLCSPQIETFCLGNSWSLFTCRKHAVLHIETSILIDANKVHSTLQLLQFILRKYRLRSHCDSFAAAGSTLTR